MQSRLSVCSAGAIITAITIEIATEATTTAVAAAPIITETNRKIPRYWRIWTNTKQNKAKDVWAKQIARSSKLYNELDKQYHKKNNTRVLQRSLTNQTNQPSGHWNVRNHNATRTLSLFLTFPFCWRFDSLILCETLAKTNRFSNLRGYLLYCQFESNQFRWYLLFTVCHLHAWRYLHDTERVNSFLQYFNERRRRRRCCLSNRHSIHCVSFVGFYAVAMARRNQNELYR